MTSPIVRVLPSLPALDRSMSVMVKLSVARGCLGAVALMRGPELFPHAGFAGAPEAGPEGAREGNASWD